MKALDKIADAWADKRKKNELYEAYIIEGGVKQKEKPAENKMIKITQCISIITILTGCIILIINWVLNEKLPDILMYAEFISFGIGYSVGFNAMKIYKSRTKKQTALYIIAFMLPIIALGVLFLIHL